MSVYMVTAGPRQVPFGDRPVADRFIAAWNETHPDDPAAGPVEAEESSSPGEPWTRVPKKTWVHFRMAVFGEGGEEQKLPGHFQAGAWWRWEFQTAAGGYSDQPALTRIHSHTGPEAWVEAHACGTDEAAVEERFEQAKKDARWEARNPRFGRGEAW